MLHSSAARRLFCVCAGTTSLLAMAPSAFAAPTPAPGWSSSVQDITTGVIQGYELGIDPLNRRLYAADARSAMFERHFLPNTALATGFSSSYYDVVAQANTAKVVQLDLDTKGFLKNFNFANLFGADGSTPGGAYTLPTTPPTTGSGATTGIATANTTQTSNNPYGVAVDVATTNPDGAPDPTIVTVQTRTSSVAIFKQSETVSNAHVLPASATGLVRARTPVVDSTRHKAYVAGYNATGGVVSQINTETRAVEATIPVPGAVGLAIDTANNLLYVGTFNATDADPAVPNSDVVRVVDLDLVNTSAPLVKENNAAAVVAVIKGVGKNARPGFDPVGKKLYTANSGARTISVVDLDPAHPATFRKVVKTIDATGSPNAIAVDPERRLVYSSDLSSRVLSVIDATTDTWVHGIPTTGNALDVDVDSETGTAYVSSMTTGTTTGAAQVQAVNVLRPADLPKGDKGEVGAKGADGAAGSKGADGAVGPAGPAGSAGSAGLQGPVGSGLSELSIALESLRLVGTKVNVEAPAAGTLSATLTAGGRTIARGEGTATKAGSISFALKQTDYGKAKLKSKKAIRGTLTVKFSPSADRSKRSTKAVKATLKATRK